MFQGISKLPYSREYNPDLVKSSWKRLVYWLEPEQELPIKNKIR